MSIQIERKLQNLLHAWLPGVVATSQWLRLLGISRGLVQKYKTNGWISQIDHGVYYKPQDTIEWSGALHALQTQLQLQIHVGGKTALELHGHGHFVPLGKQTIDLLMTANTNIPRWFSRYQWPETVRTIQSGFLPATLGLEEKTILNVPVIVSSRERAVLELLHMAPTFYDFDEVRLIMESMGTLRPDLLNELLKRCTSEKTKRLILYFGDMLGHAWRPHLNRKKIKTSSCLLKIANKGGHYHAPYNLFLPREYVIQNEQEIRF